MSKSAKIIIGLLIAVLIVWGVFGMFMKPRRTEKSLFSPDNPSQNASGFEHIIRPLLHGGFPGNGGGG